MRTRVDSPWPYSLGTPQNIPPSPPPPFPPYCCYLIITYSLHISGPFLEALFHACVREISFHSHVGIFLLKPMDERIRYVRKYVTHEKLNFIFYFGLKSII